MSNSAEAARDFCDVLDTLLLIAKHDRAPMRAVSLLEEARSEMQHYVDKIDNTGGQPVELGLKAKPK
jgi:hypothetical protein